MLLCHFEHSGDLADNDRAISGYEQAFNLTPNGHANQLLYLNNLDNSFLSHFQCSGDLADSDRAISTQERAVNLTPNGHADKLGCLNNLGNSFLSHFNRSGDLADSDRAISVDGIKEYNNYFVVVRRNIYVIVCATQVLVNAKYKERTKYITSVIVNK